MAIIHALLISVMFWVGPAAEPADREVVSWSVDKAHSEIGFAVRHMGISTVRGRFDDFDATITLDPTDPSSFRADASVDVSSINTRNGRRDGHLRSDDFFDAENHPTLTFTSKRIQNVNGNSFRIVGDLTMRGTTHEVVLDGVIVGTAGEGENQRVAIEAETTVDRFDYGLHWDRLTEAGGLVVGRDVRITLEIQAVRG
jgi:polyisoprenoid-binding protein YceI